MGTLINALKEIFSGSSQTSPTNIPTCASDGTPNGNVDMANLASVLGTGNDFNVNFKGNLDDFTTPIPPTLFYAPSGALNLPPIPTIHSFLLSVHTSYTNNDHSASNTRVMQIAVDIENRETYIRVKKSNGWSTWNHFSLDIPSFYKDYSTINALATAIGKVPPFYNSGAYNVSPNTIMKHGIYFMSPHADNPDSTSQWILCVFTCELNQSDFGVQLAFAVDNNHAYYRMIWGNHVHGSWRALN